MAGESLSGKDRAASPAPARAEGIGFACARLLGQRGARVAVTSTTDRIHERAAELAAEGIEAFGRSSGDLAGFADAGTLLAEVEVPLRACRHPRQQRRHRAGRRGEPVRRVSLVVRGDVGPGDRDQPEDGIQRDAACLSRHDRARLGQGRPRLVGDRAGGRRSRARLRTARPRRGWNGMMRALAIEGGPARGDRQLDRAGLDRDRLVDARGDRGRPQYAGRAVGHRRGGRRGGWRSCARPARATSPASRSSSTAATSIQEHKGAS